MKRTKITLAEIAELNNLSLALYKAARGKRKRAEIQRFFQYSDSNLNQISNDILNEQLPYGRYRSFYIHDPKKRLIHAACFEDRIFHHAVMNIAGAAFEKAMVDNSYACRPEKGVHKAVKNVQKHLQAYKWYGKIDIDGYFAAIDHQILLAVLMQKFKGQDIQRQLWRILQSHQAEKGEGLPIGSLTSQYFANYYLNGLDRLLNNDSRVRKSIRYMDDIIWWCDSRENTKAVLKQIKEYLWQQRCLTVKPSVQIQKSTQGVTYCGFRISQGCMRLSRRRKRRYQERRLYWEQEYQKGNIDALQLQAAYAAVHSITEGTDSKAWRQKNLQMYPAVDA